MNNVTYPETECSEFKAGDIVRMNNWNDGFADSVILGFTDNSEPARAKLARPYLYATSVGICATPLVGYEIISYVSIESLRVFYTKVGNGRVI